MAKFVNTAPAADDAAFNGLRVFHREDETRRNLVVFVHGLSGAGHRTWKTMPSRIYDDARAEADVAIFDYVSGFRRRISFSPSLDDVVRELLTQLDDLPYARIVFVAHSMGGIIASTLLRRSHELFQGIGKPPITARTAGLVALASPRAGSRVVLIGGFKDARYLKVHNAVVSLNDEFFSNHVDTAVTRTKLATYRIPVWAAKASDDRVVDRYTALHGLASDQVGTFAGTHSSFLQNSDLLSWVADRCSDALGSVSATGRPTQTVHTRFRGHPLHAYWQDSFYAAVDRFHALSEGVLVYDATGDDAESGVTHLQVRVLPASDAGEPDVQEEMLRYNVSMESGSLWALGVAPYGAGAATAAALLSTKVGPGNAWVCEADGPAALEDEILSWLRRTSRSLVLSRRLSTGSVT